MNRIQQKDIQEFAQSFQLGNMLYKTTFLITGATGLVGSNLIFCLLSLNQNIRIIAPVRNIVKANEILGESVDKIEIIECNIAEFDYDSLGDVDYIVHCAAPTSSKFFVEKPVETANIIIEGSRVLLDYACSHRIKSFVYLSSLEVYGECRNDSKIIKEDFQGYLDSMSVRSSYPMSKRMVENLCALYAKEYYVPVRVARLTQTFGPGLSKEDNRVFAQFARSIISGEDIELHTQGDSAKPYCYITDCVSAILYILLKGKSGEAYNVSNDATYISIRDLAEYLRDNYNPEVSVNVHLKDMGYAPVTKLHLSSAKLMNLGWRPRYEMKDMFMNLIEYIRIDS